MTREGDVDEDKRATLRRFAALGAASPFARFGDSGSESDAPDAIAGYVSAHPGTHFSKLRDDLKLGTGEAQHHLHRLENEDVVASQKDGDYRRYFPAGQFSEFEQVALGYLRRSTARGMLVTLLRRPDVTASELATELDVSRPTVSNYAGDLESAGLLSREDGYAVTEPETVLTLLIRYADSFDDDVAELAGEADSLLRYDP
ncbi:winged helix-turn-helix transcriptional regulator [Haloarcula sp. KBTZ06]|uniref:MarR family transcriptional regulator n=1 Tax=Haloarcula hispanica TaxID=51589 RepID=A0A482T306_HALHI|nr:MULTISPECIES: MarR family transcriptional regulator [Haloarcula]AJF24973.1 MarR family transcriptional regulator [Haloarcula sp. CBA1115]KAA9406404.1 MarR family transcriptional regulator [Haloarcula sp. CBA1131]KAA9410563.1 MarR family transcriptional regulator [Haloarcula hispanica]KZX47545.1 MarR family transcriptional regulator [Haloarcula sp. K1]MCJ0619650.1 MarR family transcriptional regulator [Haloarcula hispanica]